MRFALHHRNGPQALFLPLGALDAVETGDTARCAQTAASEMARDAAETSEWAGEWVACGRWLAHYFWMP